MLYPETQKKASKMPMPQSASPMSADERDFQVKSRKTENTAVSSKLVEEPAPRTSQRSRRSDPVSGQRVRAADDLFMQNHRSVAGVSGRQRDRERRWNSDLGSQGMRTHRMTGSGASKERQWAKGDFHDRPLRGTQPRQTRVSGVQGRPVKPAFGRVRKGVRQETASAKFQQGRLERKPITQRGTTPPHPHGKGKPVNDRKCGKKNGTPNQTTTVAAKLPVKKSRECANVSPVQERHRGRGGTSDLEHFASDNEGSHHESGSDCDMTYSISGSDLGLSADDASHDEEASVTSGEASTEDVSSDGSHDSSAESDSSEYGSGSSGSSEHSQSTESDESYDGSEDDESESTELSDEDEGDLSDESFSDDSFDDSDETEDEEDPDHVYDDPSSGSDSAWSEESYGVLEQESEEHFYDDPADLLDSDHIYEDPDDLYDS